MRRRVSFAIVIAILQISMAGVFAPVAAYAQEGMIFPHCGAQFRTKERLDQVDVSINYDYRFYAPAYRSTLLRGSRGDCVKDLQVALDSYFCNAATQLSTDGKYGEKTAAAVQHFQTYWAEGTLVDGHAPAADGIVGRQTWALLTQQEFGVPGKQSCGLWA